MQNATTSDGCFARLDHSPEREAHDTILAWCRSNEGQRRAGCIVGMRVTYRTERHIVIGLDRTQPKAGSSWEREPMMFADGATWLECLEQLVRKGLVTL